MTREEAIFCEKSYIGETNCTDCKYYGTVTCRSRESHKMAIKALAQEPCDHYTEGYFTGYDDGQKGKLEQEPCEDCISRQAVLDLKTTIKTDDYSGNEILEVVEVDDIEKLPPVTPREPKTDYGKAGWHNKNRRLEVMIKGWFYMNTTATENDKAVEEFRIACEKVGINADNITAAVIRNEDGENITSYDVYYH